MNAENQDDRIADLLRADAPPALDPMFRIRVLELRELRGFQRRLYTMLTGAIVILLISIFTIRVDIAALGPMSALAAVAALASAHLAFRGRLPQILRRLSF